MQRKAIKSQFLKVQTLSSPHCQVDFRKDGQRGQTNRNETGGKCQWRGKPHTRSSDIWKHISSSWDLFFQRQTEWSNWASAGSKRRLHKVAWHDTYPTQKLRNTHLLGFTMKWPSGVRFKNRETHVKSVLAVLNPHISFGWTQEYTTKFCTASLILDWRSLFTVHLLKSRNYSSQNRSSVQMGLWVLFWNRGELIIYAWSMMQGLGLPLQPLRDQWILK